MKDKCLICIEFPQLKPNNLVLQLAIQNTKFFPKIFSYRQLMSQEDNGISQNENLRKVCSDRLPIESSILSRRGQPDASKAEVTLK